MKLFILICTLLLGSMLHALVLKSKSGSIDFLAVGKPGFLKIKGESKNNAFAVGEVKVEKTQVQGEFQFNLENLKTGIELRDEHMKLKYLEIEKAENKTAKLKITKLEVEEGKINEGFQKPFEGELTLHGVTKPIKGTVNFNGSDLTSKVNFEIILSDFKVDIPSYMGVTVSEKVEITVSSQFSRSN